MDQRRNYKGNRKILRDEWKGKYNIPKLMGYSVSAKGKFIAINAYIKKQKKSQVNNFTLQLKELEKVEQTKPKACRKK